MLPARLSRPCLRALPSTTTSSQRMYQLVSHDHGRQLPYVGFDTSMSGVGTAVLGSSSRGGAVRMQVRVEDGIINDAQLKTVGNESAVASSTFAAERIIGSSLDDALGLADQEATVGTGQVGQAALGGFVKIQLKVQDGVVIDARFKTLGCDFAVAGSSYATEKIIGCTLEEVEHLLILDASTLEGPLLVRAALQDAIAGVKAKQEIVRENASSTRYLGSLDKHAIDVGTGVVGTASRGTVVQMQIQVQDNIVRDAKFNTMGCDVAVAASSIASEKIIGHSLEEVELLLDTDRSKTQSSTMVKQAIRSALADHKAKFAAASEHITNPRNEGVLDQHAADVGTAVAGTASRGNIVSMHIKVQDNIIKDAKFKVLGSSVTIASSSHASEKIIGCSLDEVECLLAADGTENHSASTVKDAIRGAIADYKAKHEAVSEHFSNPCNVGSLDHHARDVGTAVVGKASHGGIVKMHIKVQDGIVKDAKFQTIGCDAAIASSSYATARIIGSSLQLASTLCGIDVASQLKLQPVKAHFSIVAVTAIQAAIANYRAKQANFVAE